MTQLDTDPELLDRLRRATVRSLTRDEMDQQRVSFVMSSLSEHNDMTREQVENLVKDRGDEIRR